MTTRTKARARVLPPRPRQGGAGQGSAGGRPVECRRRARRPWTRLTVPESPPFPCPPAARLQLHTADGARKYLTAGERDAFLREAERADRQVRTLCVTLAYAGCRLSEALALTVDRVDLAAGVLVIKSLKKRRTGVYRAVPSPLPCSTRSTSCTASASFNPAAAKAVANGSGRGPA